MLRAALFAAALAAACPAAAADLNRIVLNGSDEALGVNAVADEGEGEPRSTGSYALRAPEILVVARSAGSGGYLAVDAFRFHKGVLALAASKSGLDPNADPVAAVAEAAKSRRGRK